MSNFAILLISLFAVVGFFVLIVALDYLGSYLFIKSYLKDHPQLKEQYEELKSAIDYLNWQMEQFKQSIHQDDEP